MALHSAAAAAALSALLMLSFSGLTLSDTTPSTPVSPSAACNATTDPTFCRSVLPPRGKGDLYKYGRFSVAESLAGARMFAALVDRYLARHRHLSSSAIGALRDCQLMADLNVDFLTAAGATIKTTDTLLDPQADDVHTLLSAILTNQQTCFDGLQAASGSWSDRGGLDAPIANGTKLYSLSLSLFTRAWVPTAKPAHSHKGGSNDPHHGHGHGHAVVGQGFVAVNMTFRNTAGPAKHQAVAFRSGADLSAYYGCSFEAYQDTLYTHSLRQFYRGCDIYGTVDYVFGNAAVVFQGCTFYSRLPMQGQCNTVTAQGRSDPNQNTGTSIQGCSLVAAPELAANTAFTTLSYLGRPWKNFSRTVVMESYVGALVDPSGWMPWSGDFALSTLYYAEYNNTGPGADTSRRVAWPGFHVLGDGTDAGNFTVSSMVLGENWLPQTGVPFTSGLIP
ncbi:putative pectinesterase/pectinesterase inhibitor 7 [Zea mays]|uniref:Pectinesterase n=1 Tax=Zea mays TaxID=4577 RepID=A0A3L6DSY6_MAIZE|nr:putative pectinesterase/pectinesterase inhibitor 7 [Zea mays]